MPATIHIEEKGGQLQIKCTFEPAFRKDDVTHVAAASMVEWFAAGIDAEIETVERPKLPTLEV